MLLLTNDEQLAPDTGELGSYLTYIRVSHSQSAEHDIYSSGSNARLVVK